MSRKIILSLFLAFSLGSTVVHAADPTLHEVYQAAQSGNYPAAQRMMDQVLQDHPNSAKAHFVQAELMAKQGQTRSAQAELGRAEALDSTLSFAKPGAVAELRTQLTSQVPHTALPAVQAAPAMPWGLILTGGALIAAIFFFVSRRRNAPAVMPAGYPHPAPAAYGANATGGANPAWGNGAPMSPNAPMAQGGMGSGILGGLATGAALGAGMVAGEALMHKMMGDGHRDSLSASQPNDAWGNSLGPGESTGAYDMGGQDFGVSDAASWDDSASSGGGDDWS